MDAEFLITGFIVLVSPGSGVIGMLATSIARGFHEDVATVFRYAVSLISTIVFCIAIVFFAFANHAHTGINANFSRFMAAAYLLYMAWDALREPRIPGTENSEEKPSAMQWTTDGGIYGLKLSYFFVTFLPQFVSAGEPHPYVRMLSLSASFLLMTIVTFVGYGLFAAPLRAEVASHPQALMWTRRIFGGVFLALSFRLIYVER